jgi:hypothetical protein
MTVITPERANGRDRDYPQPPDAPQSAQEKQRPAGTIMAPQSGHAGPVETGAPPAIGAIDPTAAGNTAGSGTGPTDPDRPSPNSRAIHEKM